MLGRSLGNLQTQDFGFALDNRVIVTLNRLPASYSPERLAALYRNVEERLTKMPGIQGAGLALYNPHTDNWGELVLISGKPLPAAGEQAGSSWNRVSADYLQNLAIPLVRGRYFSPADNETAENVAVVNEAFVKRFFKSDEDPIDRHFGIDLPEYVNSYRIVGIVGDAKFADFELDKPARPMFFVPMAQTVHYDNPLMARLEAQSHNVGGILLRTSLAAGALEPQLTRVLAEADANLTIIGVRGLREQVQLSLNRERSVATLAGLFGVVALLLAAIGLYGVTAYSVARSTNEIGIRMALGADRQKVIGLVLGGAFRRVVAGLLLGLPFAIGAGYLLSSQLYGISFWDPVALIVATVALGAAAFIAAVVPAARAAAIAPMQALRTE
jgi:predicted permease